MPLTPFHLGPGLLLGTLFFRFISLPAVLLASLILDIAPLVNMLRGITPWHGFFHTAAGATVAAITLIIILFLLRHKIERIMKFFNLEQPQKLSAIVIGSFIGVYLHILFDYFTHKGFEPIPGYGNPFYVGMNGVIVIYAICVITGVIGLVLLVRKMLRK